MDFADKKSGRSALHWASSISVEPTFIEENDAPMFFLQPRTRTSCSSEVVTWLSDLFFLYVFILSPQAKRWRSNPRLLLEHQIPVDVRTKENSSE